MTLTHPELDALFAHDPSDELATRYDAATGELGERIVLYGAGDFGRRTLAGLRASGIEPLAFADANPRLWGETVDGLTVLSPDHAKRLYAGRATFVVNVFNGTPVREGLIADGCRSVVPASYVFHKLPEAFLPFGGYCRPADTLDRAAELRRTMARWTDEASRELFAAQLAWRLSLDGSVLPKPSPASETYFIPEIARHGKEVFVDCGAYDGDSVQAFFAWNPEATKAIALEPDPRNGEALMRRMERLGHAAQVEVRTVAAASAAGRLSFDATGTVVSNVSSEGATSVEAVRLDDLLADEKPTFLKMDIEGAELDALEGAAETIRTHRPVLAVCLYHKPEDLWQIPRFVDSLGVDYRYALRAHAEECWELVMYAIPAERWADGRWPA